MDKTDKPNLIFAPLEWFTNFQETMKGKVFYDALGQKYTVDRFQIGVTFTRIYTVEGESFIWAFNFNKSILIEKKPLTATVAEERIELPSDIIFFLYDIETNYDCDADAHKYNTAGCRVCKAKALREKYNISDRHE